MLRTWLKYQWQRRTAYILISIFVIAGIFNSAAPTAAAPLAHQVERPILQAQTIANGGFETQGTASTDAANWTEGTNHTRANDRFHTGGWSLRSTFTGPGTSTRSAALSVQPNTTYTFSGWVFKASTTGGACIDMSDIAGELQLCASTTNTWQQLSGSWNSGGNTSLVIRLVTDGSPNGSIWFDDLDLRQSNLIANGGFETQGTASTDAANWTEGTNHTRANDRFHTGGWSLKSTFTGAGAASQTTLSVQPNTTYTFSGWVFKAATTGAACMDMSDIPGELQLCASTTNTWQQLSGSWNSGGNTSLVIRLVTDGSPNGSIWFDDLDLQLGGSSPQPTPTNTPIPTNTPSPTGISIRGKTIAGYQGWFAAAGDGSPFGRWVHWNRSGVPAPGNITFELYPDVREYPTLFQTNFANLGNGSPARLFSSYTTETVNVHFRWMREYNIDGAALQRFGGGLATDPVVKGFRDSVVLKSRSAAEANGRVFYIMYDASGMGPNFVQEIQSDWTNTIVNSMRLTSSPMYAKENGRPVVSLWGIGFPDRPGTAQEWTTLINWFKGQGVYVIGGVPRAWRTGGASVKPGFLEVFRALNMISPWTVGTYKTDADVDNHRNNFIIPDRDFCAANGIDYQPVVFPGFAWSNWNGGPRNDFPRRQGNLFWRQAFNLKSSNISTMYIAMFDEYDEGTAIAKAAEDSTMIPTNQYFLTLDADGVHLSSDFYLRLAGAANQMLKGQTPLTLTIPIPR